MTHLRKAGLTAQILHILAIAALILSSCQLPGIGAGYTVAGKALDAAGNPVAGVKVWLADSGVLVTTTADDGSFRLTGVPSGTWALKALKAGKAIATSFTAPDGSKDLSVLPLYNGNIEDVVLKVVDVDKLTISMVQGSGHRSPFEGQRVENVRGVITKITRQRQNGTYTVTNVDGSISPQWLEYDGFYMEAFGSERDGNTTTSDGIFVCTHNPQFDTPKLMDSVPTDLAVGQVVIVSGTVAEFVPMDRFNNSYGYLSVSTIVEPTVLQLKSGTTAVTQAAPAGVLITYQETVAGFEGEEIRTIPWEEDSISSLKKMMDVLESVEGMTVQVKTPHVTGGTYYNVTAILADDGKKNGLANKDLTAKGGIVLKENDFNSELLYCDYSAPDWKTFVKLPQVGDKLRYNGTDTLVGVMNYTFDGIYWISPLQTAASNLKFTAVDRVVGEATYINALADNAKISSTWHKDKRIGSSAESQFVAQWDLAKKDDLLNKNLTVSSFNIENYCAEDDSFEKYKDIADVVLYNMKAPDVITLIEMGDDRESTIIFVNQSNAYAIPDGVTWAVNNYTTIIDAIKAKSAAYPLTFGGEIEYDFREIAPEEIVDGGEPGTNIRAGFLFRKDRVAFIDRGIKTNTYVTTKGISTALWPVPGDTGSNPKLLSLARNDVAACAIAGQDGVARPRLSQSPGRINARAFRGSRKPLVGEFTFLPTNKQFFVIANHFGSKRGDTPLYGLQQPPTFGSEYNRMEQGRAVYKLVKDILAIDSRAKVVVTGDLNDFQFSLTNRTMSGAVYGRSSQVLFSPSEELLPTNEQYSYLFRGNSQQIDHIYVSKSIFDNIDTSNSGQNAVKIPHIDSIFSHMNKIETSDHDPIVVHLNMEGL